MAVTFDPILGKLRKRDVSEGGSATWGNIVGTLSDQSDLNSALAGKQNSLGYTPENVANKVASFQLTPDDTHYPTEKLVKDNIDLLSDDSFYASTMTVNTGTLDTGTVSDLAAVGGIDVNISESNGADPLRVTFDFTGVTKLSAFVFYGYYAGGSGHQMQIEIYNHLTTGWDFIGILGSTTSKAWSSFPIYNTNAYLSSGNVSVRMRHIQTGNTSHDLILDYLEINYGGAGGSTNISAASVTYVPEGNISSTNVSSALAELDSEKVVANAAITSATKTKITYDTKGLVTSGADATTADIADSLNKRYVTDAQLTVIGNTSGTNTGDETQSTIKTKLGAATASADGYATSAQITKLDGIAAGAEVNVNADWNASSGDAQILNKPTIPTQYTDEMAQDAVGGMIADTSTIDLTYTDATPELKADVKDNSITEPKLAMNDTPSDGEVIKWNATGSYMEWGTATSEFGSNQYNVDSSTPNGTYGQITGLINGSNTLFTVSASKYVSGSLKVYLNGQLLAQTSDWSETTPSSGTFTFVTAPTANDVVMATYQVSNTATGNADTLDGYHATSFFVPTGSILPYAGSTSPSSYLLCDGSSYLRADYSALFGVIGTTYGSADGTHFNVPNLKGKIPVGLNSSETEFDALGETGGAKTHTLIAGEMPSHTHTQDAHTHTQDAHTHVQDAHNHLQNPHQHGMAEGTTDGSGTFMDRSNAAAATTAVTDNATATNIEATATNQNTTATNQNTTATNQNTGGGGAHNNLQPYIVLNYIIKI